MVSIVKTMLLKTVCFLNDQTVFELINTDSQSFEAGPAPRGPGGAWPHQFTGLTPPINKLTFLKTAAFELHFKLWPLLRNAWPP